MNNLMNRLQQAQSSGENLILDQVQNDIEYARDVGSCNTMEYSIIDNGDDKFIIHDNINDEITIATFSDASINLEESPHKELTSGDTVTWVEGDNRKSGKLVSTRGDISEVDSDGKKFKVKTKILSGMESNNKEYSKSRARHYLVDSNNNLVATGWQSSLGKLLKDHPDWKMVDQYSIHDYLFKVTKQFSNLSSDTQKLFTKPYRRYVILDSNGKRIPDIPTSVDITNANGLVKKNPGWTMVKESVYNQSLQEKFKNMSDSTINMIKERGSLSDCN